MGCPAHLVPDVTHLDERWLESVGSVGISAGASAPEILMRGLVDRLTELGLTDVRTDDGTREARRWPTRTGEAPMTTDRARIQDRGDPDRGGPQAGRQGKNLTRALPSRGGAKGPNTRQGTRVFAQTRAVTLMCDGAHTYQVKTSSNSL
ncbi:hypothetical protein [Streptomyces sp. NPDC001816]|uniref:hypothetical protein n=1 Tax=Streptomyces sp. NPDC001816 TaxID=3364612 RepID=UPI0036C5F984